MIESINISPEDRQRCQILIETEKKHQANLRRRLEIRILKAETIGNQTLLNQLQQELHELR